MRAVAVTVLLLLLASACGSGHADDAQGPAHHRTVVDTHLAGPLVSAMVDLDSVRMGAEDIRGRQGRYPASYDEKAFGIAEGGVPVRGTVVYRAAADGQSYRACVQAPKHGPWLAWDSTAQQYVAAGASGRCSFAAPRRGTVGTALLDTLRLTHPARGCRALRAPGRLRREGVLSAGNTVTCKVVSFQEGEVRLPAVCVQAGKDGPWAAWIDNDPGLALGRDGSCAEALRAGMFASH